MTNRQQNVDQVVDSLRNYVRALIDQGAIAGHQTAQGRALATRAEERAQKP
jgi:hypothetical protein